MVLSASRRDRACTFASGALLEARRSQQPSIDLDSGTGIAIRRNGAAHLGAILHSPSLEAAAGTDYRRAVSVGTQSALHRQRGSVRERGVLRAAPVAGSFRPGLGFYRLLDC